MKRVLQLLLLPAVLLLCAAFGNTVFADYQVIIASDLHYIAPELTDGGEYYQRILENGDSKFMPFIQEISDAFFNEVIESAPDALLLTGDLTFNGAILSHEALADRLHDVENAGIPVFVLTGNHDVYNSNAARYQGSGYVSVPFATTDTFSSLYADFGLADALSVDTDSLSCCCQLSETARVLLLDFNTEHDFCGISDQTLLWVEEQLRDAQEAGAEVLTAGHQNLFQHSIFRGGYVVEGSRELADLFRRYDIPLFLSGHLHIQHYLEEKGLTEITTSALCSFPCQYAVLTSIGGHLHYETQRLGMAEWALRNGRTEPVFQDFAEASGQYMDAHFSSVRSLPEGVDRDMVDYLCALNRAYFSGDLSDAANLDPAGELTRSWEQAGDLTALYLASIRTDFGKSFNIWDS